MVLSWLLFAQCCDEQVNPLTGTEQSYGAQTLCFHKMTFCCDFIAALISFKTHELNMDTCTLHWLSYQTAKCYRIWHFVIELINTNGKKNIWIKQAKPHTASIKQHGFIVKVYRWCTGLPAVQPFLSQQFLDFNRLLLKEQVILHSAEHGPVPVVV